MAARAPAPRVLLCLGALLARGAAAGLEAVVIREVHENVTLPCGNISAARGPVTWYRNDSEPVFLLSSNASRPPAQPRFSLVNASSLHIEALSLQDEGNYTCWEALNETWWFHVWLQVASGPDRLAVNVSSTGTLPNGTRFAARGSRVDFGCASSSRPPPLVEWWFQAPGSRPEPFGSNRTASSFSLLLMSPNLQGNYTCRARNPLSGRQRSSTTELLVYAPPVSDLECWAEMSPSPLLLQLTCRWDGGYPDPNFLWTEEPGGMVVGTSKLETLNRSRLSDGQKFKCVGSHIAGPESGASCVVQIRGPSLLSEPMKTCFVGGNVTLTCLVSGAYPSAKILWLRNLTQPEVAIQPSSRYVISQEGQSSTLTVRNCSQALDEGYYVCRAENPVGVREAATWLSVKEPLNIVGIVGTIVSLLLLGLAVVSGLLLYYSPVLCWKRFFTGPRCSISTILDTLSPRTPVTQTPCHPGHPVTPDTLSPRTPVTPDTCHPRTPCHPGHLSPRTPVTQTPCHPYTLSPRKPCHPGRPVTPDALSPLPWAGVPCPPSVDGRVSKEVGAGAAGV